MEQFSIVTSQNISIEHTIASIGERIVASIIDVAIIGAYLFVTLMLTGLAANPLVASIFGIPALFYHFVFELAMNGESPGKSVMRIRVVSEYGTDPSFTSLFLRWVFRLIDITLLFGSIGTLFIIVTKKHQRLGDIAAKTVLLRTRPKKTNGSIFVKLPNNYTVHYPMVNQLTDTDLQTVKEVLGFFRSSRGSEEAKKYATEAKGMVEKKLSITSKQEPYAFLETVLKDYNHLYSS